VVLRLLESLTVVPSEGGEDGMGTGMFANVSCISLVAVSASLTGPSVPAAEGLCCVGRTVADATVL
jgi:hypothetical protein